MPAQRDITPTAYARILLDSLGLRHLQPAVDERTADLLWAQSGAMWLSGYAQGSARDCPAPLAVCAQGAWLALSALCPDRCSPDFEAFCLLGERAAIAGLTRRGRISAGGACHLLNTADGILALNLAREDDFDLLPAWVEQPAADIDVLTAVLRECETTTLIQRAHLLGLAVAPLVPPQPCPTWFNVSHDTPSRRPQSRIPLVIDLSALWAGPLCTQLLAQCGARVIKVESTARPDGARFGPALFYDLMNAGKESVALDLRDPTAHAQLRALLEKADIVIESARPRALEQMGISAAELVAARPGKVWLGITGYGRHAPMRDWIAYGDDAGVAAGLSWLMGGDQGDPVFCGDAIADPLTGLHAALLAMASWRSGGGQLLDVALRDVVAHCIDAGGAFTTGSVLAHEAMLPVARHSSAQHWSGSAARLGADTSHVLSEFGVA